MIVNWTDPADATADGLKLYLSTNLGVTYTLNSTIAYGVQTKALTGLTADTNYYVKLVSYKGTHKSTGILDNVRTLFSWWLQGGLTASDVLGAYKAIGVASKTASKVNLNNPGTGDLVEVGNLTWDSLTGWAGFLATKYLITPNYKTRTYSFIVLYSDSIASAQWARVFSAENDFSGTKGSYAIPCNNVATGWAMQGDANKTFPNTSSGVIGASQTAMFKDSVSIGTITPVGTEYTVAGWLGVCKTDPVNAPGIPFPGKCQALVCFLSSISDAQMIAVQNSMKATNFITDNLTLRDFSGITRYVGNPTIEHGLNAYNAFGVSTPFFNLEMKIGDTYYAIVQGTPTNWTTFDHLLVYSTTDLINWTYVGLAFSKGAGGAWDDAYIVHPSIIKIGDTWYMYYSAQGTDSEIGLATSTDLINWTKYAPNPVYSGNGGTGAYAPSVIKIGSTYYMYYWNNGTTSATTKIEYATSPDGITWTYGGVALPGPVAGEWDYFSGDGINIDPWVIKNKNGYYEMAFTATNVEADQDLGYAISRDGIKWIKCSSAILDATGSDWEATWLGDPVLVELPDGTTYLYYDGAGGAYPGTTFDAGMATV
jgi:predicted GH43/DUF377 family glycosyl hydrolase